MRVAVDLHAAAGQRTGIGVYARCLFDAMVALAPGDVELVPLGERDAPGPATRTLGRLWWEQVRLPKLLRTARPDLVHLTGFSAPWRRPCRVVLTVHDLIGVRCPLRAWGARLYWGHVLPATVGWADAVIVDSEHTRLDVLALTAVPADRVTVIHLAPGPRFHPPAPGAGARMAARFGLARPYVLGLSSLDPRKNFELLVEAFARLVRGGARDLDLVLVGAAGGAEGSVASVVARSGVAARVRLLGYVPEEDLPDLYAACACFAFPSAYEGFGLPPLEAMACGAPVVSAATSSLPEVLGEAARYPAELTPDGLAAALAAVLDDPDERRRLVLAGAARAASFSWERAARATLDVYRRQGARP